MFKILQLEMQTIHKNEGLTLLLSNIILGLGFDGKKKVRQVHARENPAMTKNMPSQPKMGLMVWVKTAAMGAAAAWPVNTNP